jgi:sodium transport system ATP-binding protein
VEELCDKVTVIDQGSTVFDGDIASFRGLAEGSLHQSFMAAIQSAARE